MRHIRISGQSMKNLASFKNQISSILRELNKFDETEKTEAVSYIQDCLKDAPNACTSADPETGRVLRTRKLKPSGKVTLIRNIGKCNRNNKIKYSNANDVKKVTFKCKVCPATEKVKRNMLRHLETHVGAPLSCKKCKRTFNGDVSFNWHLTHYCNPAKTVFKFKCGMCPREFASKRTLESHVQGHKRNNCAYCDKILTRRVHLVQHLLKFHSIKLERDMFKCQYCEKKYIKKYSLYYHLRQHLPDKFICLECGNVNDTMDDSEEHKRKHELQKHFVCPKCNERFSRRQQYLYHLKRHEQYRCVTCDQFYATKEKAVRHKQQGHEVEGLKPRFICPHCPAAFHRPSRFNIHIRKHTEENKSVYCKYCKKSFISIYHYYKHCFTINHERYSPEINDVGCEKCGKHFAKRHDLRQHQYHVHNASKQFVHCQHCDYKTIHKSNMDRHVALHFRKANQFTCEYCGKGCDSIASLKDHITYNHIQEKQFRCDKCDKSFKRNSELIRHQDSHSDERPHICTLCGKTYKRLNHLKRHETRAHELVKTTRRITKVVTENERAQSNSEILLVENSILLQENEVANPPRVEASSSSIMDQLAPYLPEKTWQIDNEDLYKVYNDATLNCGSDSLTEIEFSDCKL